MANSNESSHAINANNFYQTLNVLDRHKEVYKPTNSAIQLKSLLPVKEMVEQCIEKVSVAQIAFKESVETRRLNYAEMDSRASRAINLLKSTDATAEQIKQGKALYDKYKSERVSPKLTGEQMMAKASKDGAEPKQKKTVSVSQQGYVNKLSHFRQLCQFLKTVPAYKPLEADLTVESLTSFANMVDKLNNERNKLSEALALAIDARNKVMYSEDSSAYALASKVKAYVAGSASKDSAIYKELMKYPVKSR